MYEKKKILIEKVFDQAKKELSKNGKSPRAAYINSLFEERFGFAKNERTFVRYYSNLVEKGMDQEIDAITLDQFSNYIGYKDFETFCNTNEFIKMNEDSSFTNVNVTFDNEIKSITEKLSQIVVNISTAPVFKLPEFFTKQSNLGIMGVVLCGSLIVGTRFIKSKEDASQKGLGFLDIPKQCMYWNGKEYIPEHCNNTKAGLIAIDTRLVANFKKITRPDTIRSVKGVWYSKYQNRVEFFTADGKNPDNQKELHPVTERILEKYTQ